MLAFEGYVECFREMPSYTFCVDDVDCATAGCETRSPWGERRMLIYDATSNVETCEAN